METAIGIIGVTLVGILAIILITCFFAYVFILPYFLAKKFAISKDILLDCLISYILTWTLGLFGNAIYVLFSICLTKNDTPSN